MNDIFTLSDLTFLLYIYGYNDFVKKCIEITHDNIENISPTDGVVWGTVHLIWGLEIRILREKNETEKINKIICEFEKRNKMGLKSEEKENRRRERITIDDEDGNVDISEKSMINEWVKLNKISKANDVRLLALSRLIGYTETGFYPKLNSNKEKILITNK